MDESQSDPNPFLDCRFQVIFAGPVGQAYDVLGFFAGNGEGTGNGNIWRVIFTPDQATLAIERKLYYREMIARFGYHNAVTWNLCEEYDYWQLPISPDMAKSWAQYVYDLDPYDHPITVHNYAQYSDCAWKDFWGDTRFGAVSLQYRYTDYAFKVKYFRDQIANCGRKIPVCIDEPIGTSQQADLDGCENNRLFCGSEYIRKNLIYPVYYSGGQLELFLEEKLSVEDFTKYETAWDYMWYARNSIRDLDISSMQPHHDYVRGRTSSELCFTNGHDYAIYLPDGGECQLNLPDGTFLLKFYNPRTGESEVAHSSLEGNRTITIGRKVGEDWVIILVKN
jgi:hypothetical protein